MKAKFNIVIAQQKADAEIQIPEDIKNNRSTVLKYISSHIDNATVTRQYTDDNIFIHAESLELEGDDDDGLIKGTEKDT